MLAQLGKRGIETAFLIESFECKQDAIRFWCAYAKGNIPARSAVAANLFNIHVRLRLLAIPVFSAFLGSILLVCFVFFSGTVGLLSPILARSESKTPNTS